jgi:hypothetical protein
MKKYFLLLLILLSNLALSVNKVRIALFEVRAINTSQVYADKLYSELRLAFSKSKKIVITTGRKEDLVKKIEEWKKSGCTEVECMANAGSELGVDKVVSAELREMPGGYYEVDVIVIDVLSQEIEFIIPSLKVDKVNKFNELATKVVDAIESKIVIQPVIIAVGEGDIVFMDAGADFGIEKGMRFKVERWLNVQLDERGKVIYAEKQEVGEIEIVEVQPAGSKARIIKQNMPFERGDKAVFEAVAEKIDEPPAIFFPPVQASVTGKDIEISANIIDDDYVQGAYILYRNKGESQYKTVEMKPVSKDKFVGIIPTSDVRSNYVEMMIKAIDSKGQETIKKDIGDKPFTISIMPDNIPPEIQHTPIASVNIGERTFIRCVAKDNVKVGRVFLKYKKPNDLAYSQIELTYQGGSAYACELPDDVKLNTDRFLYYIVAQDLAGNTATFGSEMKPFAVKVEFKDVKGPTIVHIPVKEYKSGVPINILADVKDESGISKVELFYRDEHSAKFSSIQMSRVSGDRFSATLQTQTLMGKFYYYISAEDNNMNVSTLPSPESPFVVVSSAPIEPALAKATVDNTSPFVNHFPVEYYRPGLGYPITVLADDETGVSKVIFYYKTPQDRDYKSRYLRNFAPQSYGDYVTEQSISYYIVVIDYNQNVSMVGSPQRPIVIQNGKRISGDWQYFVGTWPKVPKPAIQLISPLGIVYDENSKSNEFEFIYPGSDMYLTLEGLVASYRDLKVVLVNLEQASILPVTGSDIGLSKLKGPLYKFKAEVPIPERYSELEIRAIDISGLTSAIKLKVTRTIEIAHKLKPEIKIILPEELLTSDMIRVNTNTLQIVGIVNSEFPVKSVILNNSPVSFVALSSEEKSNYKARGNSVKFSFELSVNPGTNTVHIISTDNMNNSTSKTLTIIGPEKPAMLVDVTPPDIKFLSPTEKLVSVEKVYVSAIIADNSKVDNVKVIIRGMPVPEPKLRWVNDKTVIFEDTVKLYKGLNKISIVADDGINTNTGLYEITYIPKRSEPEIIVLSPKDTMTTEREVLLSFIARDEEAQPMVMVLINGQLARGISLKRESERSVSFERKIVLDPGVNTIRILAWNEAVHTSKDIVIRVVEKPVKIVSTKDFYRNSWAVLIGINNYKNFPKLKYAVKDAKAIKEVLIKNLGFSSDKIIEIYDEKATRENILSTLGDKLSNSRAVSPDDRIFIFFAGHGVTRELPAGGEMGYLVPIDGEPERLHSTCISMTEISNISRLIPAKHVFFVIDACYGGLAGWLTSRRASLSEQTMAYVEKKTKERGRQLITAGQKDEEVYESDIWGHSVFVYFLIRGLKGSADLNNDGVITASELYQYIEPLVSNETNQKQTPQFRYLPAEGEGEFVFIIENPE